MEAMTLRELTLIPTSLDVIPMFVKKAVIADKSSTYARVHM